VKPAEHVVFGAGPVGLSIAEAVRRRGNSVRVVSRSGRASGPTSADVVAADATDPASARAVSAGARFVYQVMAPPYPQWVDRFPALQAGVVDAAEHAGARLISFENTYMYGDTGGGAFTEDSPHQASTRKGRLRADMARQLAEAERQGRVQVLTGRASDYFGPTAGARSQLGSRVVPAARQGGAAQVLGNPDQPHTYTYVPDIGTALVALTDHDDAFGRTWHLPNPPTITTREAIDLLFQAAGTRPRLRAAPRAILRLMGLFNADVRELHEMLYQFEQPHIIDSSRITHTYDLHATPWSQAAEETVRSWVSG
jgi:nucleoside-diphosphate-sugar epimerase